MMNLNKRQKELLTNVMALAAIVAVIVWIVVFIMSMLWTVSSMQDVSINDENDISMPGPYSGEYSIIPFHVKGNAVYKFILHCPTDKKFFTAHGTDPDGTRDLFIYCFEPLDTTPEWQRLGGKLTVDGTISIE